MVEIVGNAGMGKTRLLAEFRAEAPDLPELVAGCEVYESSVPYCPSGGSCDSSSGWRR